MLKFIAPDDYTELGKKRVKALEDHNEKLLDKVMLCVNNMDVQQHLNILNEVLSAHAVGKKIKVTYSPPGIKWDVLSFLEELIREKGWRTITSDKEIVITNVSEDSISMVDVLHNYVGYPYKACEKIASDVTKIGFATSKNPVKLDETLLQSLIDLQDYIKVEIFQALVEISDLPNLMNYTLSEYDLSI